MQNYYYYYYYYLWVFNTSVRWWLFIGIWNLQISRTLLSILADFSNAVVWVVLVRPLISNSSNSFSQPLEIVLSVLITISITVNFIFHSFFSPLARSKCLFLFSFSLIFTLLSAGMAKSTSRQVPFFFRALLLGLVFWLVLDDIYVCKNPRELWASHSLGWILVCSYTICSYGQLSISCTIRSGSPGPHPVVSSLIDFLC